MSDTPNISADIRAKMCDALDDWYIAGTNRNKLNLPASAMWPVATCLLEEIEKAGYVIFKKDRIKECENCDAAVTIWLQEDLDRAEKSATELHDFFNKGNKK